MTPLSFLLALDYVWACLRRRKAQNRPSGTFQRLGITDSTRAARAIQGWLFRRGVAGQGRAERAGASIILLRQRLLVAVVWQP